MDAMPDVDETQAFQSNIDGKRSANSNSRCLPKMAGSCGSAAHVLLQHRRRAGKICPYVAIPFKRDYF
ncbi:hypothetical protein [Rhizobium sp. F40D2]|uniref:hypothetical protein n=1 Tax=Rhizobium sp. F40D2 TaxID=3453141 RepID=UPI003F29A600